MIDELQRQWGIIQGAPAVVLPLIAAVAGGAWWLAMALHRSKVDGLDQQLAVRDERLKHADERVKQAEERVRDHKEKREEVERQFARLPAGLVSQLGPGLVGSLRQYEEAGRALEEIIIPAALRASEAPDTASIRGDVR